MRIINRLKLFGLIAAFLALAATLTAQATITPTTLSAALTATGTNIVVASATGFVKGYTVVIDSEVMNVSSAYVSGTTIPVIRGASVQVAHATSSAVYFGPPNYFSVQDPAPGPCTSTAEIALPRIVIPTRGVQPGGVSIYNCVGATTATQTWQKYVSNGFGGTALAALSGRAGAPPTYTASGAIALMPGIVYIGASGAGAMTLANPTTAQNGMVMVIYASTAQAHTVTYTAGFFGTTTSSDVATFGGAVGDNMVIYAQGGQWWALVTRNVTIA